jgi:hypothetical protein
MRARRLLASTILCVIPAFAHHSVATDFDVSRTVRIRGTISKVEFSNPHVTFSLDVKNPDSTVTQWNVEFASPNLLVRSGVTRDLLAKGTTITLEAYPAKDGSSKASGRTVTFSDGYKFAAPGFGQNTCDGPGCIRIQPAPVK